MNRSSSMSLYQIRMEGWKALTERLGPAGAMRFMMQYDPGHGDYTKERHQLFAALTSKVGPLPLRRSSAVDTK